MTASFSEYGQDRWLDRSVFHGRRNGVFVEAGALDGILHSNTLFFERCLGWTGVLVEPNPRVYPDLVRNRPAAKTVNCALTAAPRVCAFEAIHGPFVGWSGLPEFRSPQDQARIDARINTVSHTSYNIAGLPLADVLDSFDITKVDYLSLDVEGSEWEVLVWYPFERIPIEVIGVEDNWGNPHLAELMRAKGYVHVARIGVDEIWRREGTQ